MTYTPIGHPAVDRPEVSRSAFGYLVVDNLTDLDSRVTTNASGKADKTTTVSAGTGLTGGGDLSANRTLTVAYGTTAGTAAQGNDTRVANAVQTSRLVTAGTGLTGGGDLSADRTLTVAYGNTSTTAASGDRATALETIGNTVGRWYSTAAAGTTLDAATANGTPIKVFDTVATTAANVTYSAATGLFTVANAGVYDIQANIEATNITSGAYVGLFIRDGASDFRHGYQLFYCPAAAITIPLSCSANSVTLSAGGTFAAYVISTTGNVNVITGASARRSINLGVNRVK